MAGVSMSFVCVLDAIGMEGWLPQIAVDCVSIRCVFTDNAGHAPLGLITGA
jgi:hypothetical protein